MLIELYLLLSLVDHGLASQEAARHGGSASRYVRCLNSAGRWAVHGSTHSPLLVWRSFEADAARAAAERASRARGRAVEVIGRGSATWVEGREIRLFGEALEPALLGHRPLGEARSRRLRTEADKLAAFCLAVRGVLAAADGEAAALASRAAAKALHAKFGGGSITACLAWLDGRAGREALRSVLAGEVELGGELCIGEVVEVVAMAEELQKNQQGV